LDYVENDVSGYKERSTDLQTTGGAMALAVESATYKSFTSNLGVQLARAISTGSGVIIPQASAEWVHEFEDGGESVKARYLNDINQTSFLIATTDLDSDYFELALGVSGQFQGGRSAFISYRTIVGYDGLTYSVVEAGFRFEL
jgi:outer membrane autotransporter protein